jgi:hypothetical protein
LVDSGGFRLIELRLASFIDGFLDDFRLRRILPLPPPPPPLPTPTPTPLPSAELFGKWFLLRWRLTLLALSWSRVRPRGSSSKFSKTSAACFATATGGGMRNNVG